MKRENESSNCKTTGVYYSNRVRISLTRNPSLCYSCYSKVPDDVSKA